MVLLNLYTSIYRILLMKLLGSEQLSFYFKKPKAPVLSIGAFGFCLSKYLCNDSEPNLAKPMVLLDVAYPPNNFMQRYVYECKHSPHILDKVAWL